MDNSFRVGAFIFEDEYDYKEAKKEAESIEYIKANTNLADLNITIKLYNKLVERGTFKTVVGIEFLNELRARILKEKIVDEKNLACIRIEKSGQKKAYSTELSRQAENKNKEIIKSLNIKLRNMKIVTAFLALIIAGMILIAVFAKNNSYADIENEIINRYSAWAEELSAREKALKEKEAQLNQD